MSSVQVEKWDAGRLFGLAAYEKSSVSVDVLHSGGLAERPKHEPNAGLRFGVMTTCRPARFSGTCQGCGDGRGISHAIGNS